ncbi:hypothetical protein Acr_24g0017710 [Actinidia rufa]|uniref:Uncharacterized protein n=1 Tax=Actinidia rufa TaxID=165716 RepID=A0A7J0GXT5_9ERIC|nr:hypothetical protein Acr_24g0017710 [Actinidia rufa]
MRGGNFREESEAKVGDTENDEPERFILGLSTGSPDESESQMVDASRDLGERERRLVVAMLYQGILTSLLPVAVKV